MNATKRILSVAILLALILSMATGCGGGGNSAAEQEPAAPAEKPAEAEAVKEPVQGEFVAEETGFERVTAPGTLTVGTTGSVNGFDPAGVANTYGCDLVYEYLIRRDPETLEFVCGLAESYELVDDTTAVFHLRDNVYFSNGDKLTAEDVIFSVEHMLQSRTASNYMHIDFENSYCEDDLTAVFKFKYAYGPWESSFAICYIMSKNAADSMSEDDYWDKPVGTGPYYVVENVAGSHSTYALREDYWDADNLPEAKEITVRAYADTSTMFIDFENGVLDIVTNIGVTDVERLVSGGVSDCTYVIKSLPDNILLAMNSSNEYLQDENVRAAICYGVDFPAVGEAAKGVMYKDPTSSLPSDLPFYVNVGQYEYDPDLAREYLAASGYGAGDVTLTMIIDSNNVNDTIAEAVQAYLADVGIAVNIEAYDMQTAISHYREGDADLSCKQLPAGVTTMDPQAFYSTMQADTTNLSVLIAEDEFQALLDDSVYTNDTDARAAAYEQLQQWLVDNYWDPAVCESCACYAYRSYISNVDCLTPMQLLLKTVTFAE